ncbi:L,D-transpeptidase [Aureimonas leprariae]|uniref:L,D-transpeptidase n=1 Tax=Plantimonas leprariae TaxID=2615207 RepID=A0A7V7PS80_9HYPH|nr:L,D-transpeptidase [Aureimonas leprariae]KAB0681901.1 L,D-transpeptidase [Aureimonas leprariae]
MRQIIAALATVLCLLVVGEAEAGPRLVARVNISSQMMTVSYNGEIIEEWPVSTARKGFVTPMGRYRPTRLSRMWYSRKYDNSPMPHSIFFRGGYAIHGTGAVRSLGRPASHGCVRLHPSDAAALYAMVRDVGPGNTAIVITR